MIIEFLADGFEMIEALTPVDLLRRVGANVVTVSLNESGFSRSTHNVLVKADASISELSSLRPEEAEMIILPGGMPGADNLFACGKVTDLLMKAEKNGTRLAAICAAPSVLGRLGLLDGRKATCYPGFEAKLIGADVIKADNGGHVVTDGNITTASGMGVSLQFAKELVSVLYGPARAEKMYSTLMAENR